MASVRDLSRHKVEKLLRPAQVAALGEQKLTWALEVLLRV